MCYRLMAIGLMVLLSGTGKSSRAAAQISLPDIVTNFQVRADLSADGALRGVYWQLDTQLAGTPFNTPPYQITVTGPRGQAFELEHYFRLDRRRVFPAIPVDIGPGAFIESPQIASLADLERDVVGDWEVRVERESEDVVLIPFSIAPGLADRLPVPVFEPQSVPPPGSLITEDLVIEIGDVASVGEAMPGVGYQVFRDGLHVVQFSNPEFLDSGEIRIPLDKLFLDSHTFRDIALISGASDLTLGFGPDRESVLGITSGIDPSLDVEIGSVYVTSRDIGGFFFGSIPEPSALVILLTATAASGCRRHRP
ncbi:MAG: hypothetical protein AAF333_05440 [Planctomycetota bacterium]